MSKSKDVAAFHHVAAPYSPMSRFRSVPGLPSIQHRGHVLALVTEEYTELVTAMIDTKNFPEAADAFLDIMYVCLQGLLSMGLAAEEIDALWVAVHHANMTKVDPVWGLLDENEGKPYHTDSGKITKPPGFAPPDIEGLINEMRRKRTDARDAE